VDYIIGYVRLTNITPSSTTSDLDLIYISTLTPQNLRLKKDSPKMTIYLKKTPKMIIKISPLSTSYMIFILKKVGKNPYIDKNPNPKWTPFSHIPTSFYMVGLHPFFEFLLSLCVASFSLFCVGLPYFLVHVASFGQFFLTYCAYSQKFMLQQYFNPLLNSRHKSP